MSIYNNIRMILLTNDSESRLRLTLLVTSLKDNTKKFTTSRHFWNLYDFYESFFFSNKLYCN